MFDDYDGQMPCNCTTDGCRQVVGGRDWQRLDLQRRYDGYFSWYLQRKIDERPEFSGDDRSRDAPISSR